MLSFLLPEYESAMRKLYDEVYYNRHMLDEILSRFPPKQLIHHGCIRQVSTPSILDTPPTVKESKFSIETRLFHETDALRFRDVILDLVASLINQQKAHAFEIMSQTSGATGNTVESKGRNFWELYIAALEKLDCRVQASKFYVNSNTAKRIMAVPPTEKQINRAKDVMKAKREEFLAKRRSRRLT
jgi:hypothetical protein